MGKMPKELDKYLNHIKSSNLLEAAEKAKHKSSELLEEQGLDYTPIFGH